MGLLAWRLVAWGLGETSRRYCVLPCSFFFSSFLLLFPFSVPMFFPSKHAVVDFTLICHVMWSDGSEARSAKCMFSNDVKHSTCGHAVCAFTAWQLLWMAAWTMARRSIDPIVAEYCRGRIEMATGSALSWRKSIGTTLMVAGNVTGGRWITS